MMLSMIAAVDSSNMIPVTAIVAGCTVGAIVIIFGILNSMSQRKQVEKSRREIAAYIAEGSMTPEEGERLLNAGAEQLKGCSK